MPPATTEGVVGARSLGPSSRPRRSKPSIDTTTKFDGVPTSENGLQHQRLGVLGASG